MAENMKPSQYLENFLSFLDQCEKEYKYAYDNVNKEDRRLQDLVHEIEFASDKAARNRAATGLQRSRKEQGRG